MGKKIEPNLRERAVFLINPKKGNELFQKRLAEERKTAPESERKMAATGYGNHGASLTLNSMIGWIAGTRRWPRALPTVCSRTGRCWTTICSSF